MKLIVNLSTLGQRPTGLGVYASNCLGILKAFKVAVISSGRRYAEADEIIDAPASIAIGGGTKAAIKRQMWLQKLRFPDALVYSPTHHGLLSQMGQIITIHDLISLRFPGQHYLQYLYFKYVIPFFLRRCSAVFTVSEATRQDVAETYNYPLSKIFVVPNAVDAKSFTPGEVATANPYLLMVGARYPHKNVDEVLRVAHLWKNGFRLVITSCGGKYRSHLEKMIDDLGIGQYVDFMDYVDRSELIRLYQGCAALLYPSKWEGFGIPPLEAFACGRPVIASDIPAHREVLKEAAFFVELGSEESWRVALSGICDMELTKSKIRIGLSRAKFYSKEHAVASLERSLLSVAPNLECK